MSATEVVNQIESHFNLPQLRDWLLRYRHLRQQNNDPQSFTYVGINFKSEQLHSIKFYAHTFTSVSELQAQDFIPHTKDFSKYNKCFTNSNQLSLRNAGIAFELKYKIESKMPVLGFFSHVDNLQILSKQQSLAAIDLSKAASGGINYEYTGSETLIKNYYYFSDKNSSQQLRKLFNVPHLPPSGLYEYSFANNLAKLNVYGWNTVTDDVIQQHFSANEQEVIHYLNQKYGFHNPGIGVYLNQPIKSVYFFADRILSNTESNTAINSDAIQKVLQIQ